MSVHCRPRRALRALRQRGQAMLLTVLLLGVGVSAVVYNFVAPKQAVEREKITAAALAQARDALIGRAAADDNRPGSLPCPDIDNDGALTMGVDYGGGGNCTSNIGRLPWRYLGLPDLRDGSGERLWYAVSPNFQDSAGVAINSDTDAQLTINGAPDPVIAIVLAPGQVVGNQQRDAASQNNVANYLEGGNENGSATNAYFTSAATAFNDRLISVTRDALFSVVETRVLKELRNALRTYRTSNGYLPSANPYSNGSFNCDHITVQGRPPLNISAGCSDSADWASAPVLPGWFGTNSWQNVTHYIVGPCRVGMSSDSTVQTTLNTMCTTMGDPNLDGIPIHAIAFSTGRALAGQSRPSTSVIDYLEDMENQNNDFNYITPTRSSTNNDRVVIVWP